MSPISAKTNRIPLPWLKNGNPTACGQRSSAAPQGNDPGKRKSDTGYIFDFFRNNRDKNGSFFPALFRSKARMPSLHNALSLCFYSNSIMQMCILLYIVVFFALSILYLYILYLLYSFFRFLFPIFFPLIIRELFMLSVTMYYCRPRIPGGAIRALPGRRRCLPF